MFPATAEAVKEEGDVGWLVWIVFVIPACPLCIVGIVCTSGPVFRATLPSPVTMNRGPDVPNFWGACSLTFCGCCFCCLALRSWRASIFLVLELLILFLTSTTWFWAFLNSILLLASTNFVFCKIFCLASGTLDFSPSLCFMLPTPVTVNCVFDFLGPLLNGPRLWGPRFFLPNLFL